MYIPTKFGQQNTFFVIVRMGVEHNVPLHKKDPHINKVLYN
jgi:hypothetical protein